MANPIQPTILATGCHDTALCIIPPRSLWSRIDELRSRYDKAYGKWPPHINLIYPFVQVDALPRALDAIQSVVQTQRPFRLQLSAAGVFSHRNHNTIFIHDADEERNHQLKNLRSTIIKALGQEEEGESDYRMHMTIGQSEHMNESWHQFLLQKAGLLPEIEWEVDQLFILVREKVELQGSVSTEMKIWATVDLADGNITRLETLQSFPASLEQDAERICFSHAKGEAWTRCSPVQEPPSDEKDIPTIAVATYNVLAEFHYPPSQKRYPLIVQNILSNPAKADVLVLQEVTDDFLSYLLGHQGIHDAFRFCSHGPPDQDDVEPLPSHNNIVVLSNHVFSWKTVPFDREHKGALIARFATLGQWHDSTWTPLILAAVHLTHGLKTGAVSARKKEIEKLFKYLADEYAENATILAGDFNITTSSYTINQALEKNSITPQAAKQLQNLDRTFLGNGYVDTLLASQLEKGSILDGDIQPVYEGEQGATYDPIANPLAAEIVGSGFNMRPQRYDRILVNGCGFSVLHFNRFGEITQDIEGENGITDTLYASDHWGIRAVLKLGREPESQQSIHTSIPQIQLRETQGTSANETSVLEALQEAGAIPSEDDIQSRADAFELVKNAILEPSSSSAATEAGRSKTPLVVVPVGSYGLGVWTSTSDVDCLCIGPFSSKVFFSLAAQRLRKHSDRGIKIIRRIKAHTGIMMELDVRGVKVDLQYASSQIIAENWPRALQLPASHPVWSMSGQTLTKLKAIRDLDYILRSVPDIIKFRTAHRLIKTWAKRRGIYTAKFGYLGGIQIAVLLARVYKTLARYNGALSVSDILATFFNYYATFDWKNDLAFDPFFHKNLSYRRTAREPIAILGYFPPALNTALNASIPTVQTIAEEFQRADRLLADNDMAWSKLLATNGAADFLDSFKSYIKIDVQFWGGSLTKGRGFVGWVESRCVSLLVDLQKRLPDLYARIWPCRWVEKPDHETTTDAEEKEDADNYQGFYLIGLDKMKENLTAEEEKMMRGTLLSILTRFEAQIHGDEKYYDEKTSWMKAGVTKAAELKHLEVDDREWGEYALGDDDLDEEDDEEEEYNNNNDDNNGEGPLSELTIEDPYTVPWHKMNPKPRTNSPRSVVVPKPEGAGKFRTSSDVLNRLRWDPAFDSGDYIVGYQDRFVGVMERGLEAWKSEQTDEEFIPQHRIMYFKRKTDGLVMWERRTRKDLLFGSG